MGSTLQEQFARAPRMRKQELFGGFVSRLSSLRDLKRVT
jgi:hypothetical protein